MIEERHLEVKKTARYFTLGELTEQTKYVWFVLHGYGELAAPFLERFQAIQDSEHFFVAPEGLSKFYWKGFGTKPVASWMTSEDRENEIKDYLAYLNQLYSLVANGLESPVRQVALGFSQGTATVTRWVADSKSSFDQMVLWAGPLAHDIDWSVAGGNFQKTNNILVSGLQDQFIQASDLEKQKEYLEKIGFSYQHISYEGGHEIHEPTLKELHKIIDCGV